MTDISFAVISIAAMCVAAYSIREMRRSVEASASTATQAVRALSQVKGLSPHHVAPEVFAPNGVAHQAIKEMGEKQADAGVVAAKKREIRNLKDAIPRLELIGDATRAQMARERLSRLENEA